MELKKYEHTTRTLSRIKLTLGFRPVRSFVKFLFALLVYFPP